MYLHGHGTTRLLGLEVYVYFCPVSLMGLGIAFHVLGFLENTAKIVTAQRVIGFCVLSSTSLCGGL